MKKIVLLILLNLLIGQSWGQTWTRTQLDNHVSIDFPSIPDVQEIGNKKIYQISESTYIINVLTADMSLNPNFDIKTDGLSEFYKGVIKGKLDAATNSKLLEEKEIDLNHYEGRQIEYTKDFNGMSNILVTGRIILVDKVFYTFEIWDLSGKGQNKLTKKFFKSIEFK
jgi:hypothetical protein